MSHRRVSLIISLFSLLTLVSLVGCGGGGGGGGAVFTPIGGGFTPIGSLGVAPTGFSSAAFPAADGVSTLVVENFAADQQAVVILANNSTQALRTSISANLSSPVAGVRNMGVVSGPKKYPPGAALSAELRERARRLPPYREINPALMNRSMIRADQEAVPIEFNVYYTGKKVSALLKSKTKLDDSSDNMLNIFLDVDLPADVVAAHNVLIPKYATEFKKIYATVRKVFGGEPPATFNGLGGDITILISDKIADDPLVAGLFYDGDLYPISEISNSNFRKMFYLNSNTQLSETTMVSTLAHEFQHMVNFYQRKINNLSEETWLNEAISGYAEHVCGYTITTKNGSKCSQVSDFLAAASATPLLYWNPDTGGTNEQYGQAYLFGTYLAQKYGRTEGALVGVMKALLNSTSVGVAAVTNFANGVVSGENFDRVFTRFVTALYVNDYAGNSYYGFQGLNLNRPEQNYEIDGFVVTLRGPSLLSGSAQGYLSGDIPMQPYSSAYIVLSGGNGNTLSINIPTTLTVLELTK